MKESRYNMWVERKGAFYVYNGVSGALLRVPGEDYYSLRRFLTDQQQESCRPALLVELVKGRMLVVDECDELNLLAKRYQASKTDTSHLALTMITSLGCNFACPYCFEAKRPSIMSEEVQQAILQLVDDQMASGLKSLSVTWFGGEPLVGKQPLFKLSKAFIERCDHGGVQYSAQIITNGYLLDEETCVQLRECRVSHAQVTLDGPPEVHDRMRPLAGGEGTFWPILENVRQAINHLSVNIRVNLNAENFLYSEELLQILAGEDFAGKLAITPGQLVIAENDTSPSSATCRGFCFTNREFAQIERRFAALVRHYGFGSKEYLPGPRGTPCTAVRANEWVVGSEGELYKCWESVGDGYEVVGNVRNYRETNGNARKWLKRDPISDLECQTCIALPVCMGGCTHHALDPKLYNERCETFRHNYEQQILAFVEAAEEATTAEVSSRSQ